MIESEDIGGPVSVSKEVIEDLEILLNTEAKEAIRLIKTEAKESLRHLKDEADKALLMHKDAAQKAVDEVTNAAKNAVAMLKDEARKAELAPKDGAKKAEVFIKDEAKKAEILLKEEAKKSEVSLKEKAIKGEGLFNDEAKSEEVQLEDKKDKAEHLIKKGADEAELLLKRATKAATILPKTAEEKSKYLIDIAAGKAEDLLKEGSEKAILLLQSAEAMAAILPQNAVNKSLLLIETAANKAEVLLNQSSQRIGAIINRESQNLVSKKNTFLDIAAHELRTPVTSVSLLLQVAEKQLEKGQSVDAKIFKKIRSPIDRLARLVVDLLDMSRLERGIFTLAKERIDLVSLISEIVDEFKTNNSERHFLFVRPDRPVELEIDPVRINQVLTNLLDNALKYAKEGAIEIKLNEMEDKVQVSVTDHGPGIPRDQQQVLFKAFSRGSSKSANYTDGLGLGLSICRSIMDLHEGTIQVVSKEGSGSTFIFELPKKNRTKWIH